MSKKSELLIGVDGNEANLIQNRVGSNQAVFGLLNGLSNVDKFNEYVIYLASLPLPDMPISSGQWHYRVIPPAKMWTQWRLPLDLYTHTPKPDIFLSPSHYAPRFSPVPNVVIIADLGYLKFPQFYTKKDYWQLKNWTEYSIKKSVHIIAVSETTKKDLIEYYKIPPTKISVIYHGYDKNLYRKMENKSKVSNVLKKYCITKPYILFLGSLRPTKNIERLIEAFSMLKNKETKLVLAGKKGWMYASVFKKISELKLGMRVVFTDYVPSEDLPYIISGTEVFTLPSLYEGFGIPVIEAMACGVPTLVSNVGSLPEVVQDASVIVDPFSVEEIANGIDTAVKKRNVLIDKGFRRIKYFDWKDSARKTLRILEEAART
ncbi:hypothetical protein A2892_02090 [Candidatus Woesebacteria bacterium RIFCSPLOWO2_01_FULL_39_10b]|uniref:Glycosyl transferase family 1 domain-containing protein n=1 Tax=Candidatus Woesebacteria bacterium RIFCSPLOWO2_01_FULL_39_10b TaxID=1802517 RepID=A0A1F8B9U4_9BACT|nr:MAG: hypothetical protein A2892_02090 [Candidatus Woesebacteria bacterium RIFCSPLOWO2_01_FULL_39_10b]